MLETKLRGKNTTWNFLIPGAQKARQKRKIPNRGARARQKESF